MPVPLCLLSEGTVWATRGSRTCNWAPFPRPRNWGSEKSDSTQSTPELVQHVQGPSVPALERPGTSQHGSSLLSFPRVETWGPWWWGDAVRTRIWGSDSQTKTLFYGFVSKLWGVCQGKTSNKTFPSDPFFSFMLTKSNKTTSSTLGHHAPWELSWQAVHSKITSLWFIWS